MYNGKNTVSIGVACNRMLYGRTINFIFIAPTDALQEKVKLSVKGKGEFQLRTFWAGCWRGTEGKNLVDYFVCCLVTFETFLLCFCNFRGVYWWKFLSNSSLLWVNTPRKNEVYLFINHTNEIYSALDNSYAVIDGLKVMPQQSGDCDSQGLFYNGRTYGHYVVGVCLWSLRVV